MRFVCWTHCRNNGFGTPVPTAVTNILKCFIFVTVPSIFIAQTNSNVLILFYTIVCTHPDLNAHFNTFIILLHFIYPSLYSVYFTILLGYANRYTCIIIYIWNSHWYTMWNSQRCGLTHDSKKIYNKPQYFSHKLYLFNEP